jgi:hypothetical protein
MRFSDFHESVFPGPFFLFIFDSGNFYKTSLNNLVFILY